MEGLLFLISVFNYSFGLVLAFVFNIDESTMVRATAIFALCFSFYELLKSWGGFESKVARSRKYKLLLFFVFLLLSLIMTILLHGGELPPKVKSAFLTLGTRVLSGILLGIAWNRRNVAKKIVSWIEPYCLFNTIVLLYAVSLNKGQLAINLAVSRQTLSYSGAYCIALLLFLNFNHSSLSLPILLKYTFWKWINWGLVVLDLYIVFAGAGRGAFVLSGVILIYFVFTQIKTMDFMKIAEVAALIFIAFAGIVYASKSSSISSGFQAIESLFLNGFTDRSSTERLDFYYEAYEYAKNNYFIGGGTCTVEYVLGNYSHNMFMDILVDFGLIGVLFALYKFGGIVCKGMRLADKHSYFQMLFIMFLCGFIGLQFSGSWLAETALWFPFSAIYLYIEKNRKTQEIILQI